MRKWFTENVQCRIVGWGCFLCFMALPITFLWLWSQGTISKPDFTQERAANCRRWERKHPFAGERRTTKDGIKGTVTRECWLGINRYEFRLQDGSITYVNGKDFLSKARN